jgi:hypothetical protein
MKCIALFAIAGALWGAPPTITELQPRGAERGKPFKLTVIGRDLPDVIHIQSTMPASFTQVLETDPAAPVMSVPGRAAFFLVEPKADLPPGVYPIDPH